MRPTEIRDAGVGGYAGTRKHDNAPGIVDHKVMLNGLVAMRNEMVVLPVLPPEGDDKFWALVGTFAF